MGHTSADPVSRLPTELLTIITATFTPSDIASTLTVSSAWRAAFSRTVHSIRPHGPVPTTTTLSRPFPKLQQLYLERCEGAAYTDKHIKDVAQLPDLQHLSLEGFRNCTDDGVAALACLTGEPAAAQLLSAVAPSTPDKLTFDEFTSYEYFWWQKTSQPRPRPYRSQGLGAAVMNALLKGAAGAGLQELCLNSCTHLSHQSLAHLAKASRLAKLDLSHCKWVEDQDLAVLKGYMQLRELSLVCCHAITTKGLPFPGGATSLMMLLLS